MPAPAYRQAGAHPNTPRLRLGGRSSTPHPPRHAGGGVTTRSAHPEPMSGWSRASSRRTPGRSSPFPRLPLRRPAIHGGVPRRAAPPRKWCPPLPTGRQAPTRILLACGSEGGSRPAASARKQAVTESMTRGTRRPESPVLESTGLRADVLLGKAHRSLKAPEPGGGLSAQHSSPGTMPGTILRWHSSCL